MSAADAKTRRPAPDFGQHTREVLAEYLDLDGEALESLLAELRADGVIADAPREGMVARDQTRLESMLASGLLREIDPEYNERLRAHLGGEE